MDNGTQLRSVNLIINTMIGRQVLCMHSGTPQYVDTPEIRTLSCVPIVAILYKSTPELWTPHLIDNYMYLGPNGVRSKGVPLYTIHYKYLQYCIILTIVYNITGIFSIGEILLPVTSKAKGRL